MTPSKKRGTQLSDKHKAALAEGRTHGRAVRRYLEALAANKPKRGRKRTPDSIKKRLEKLEAELQQADQLRRLHLVQERLNLQMELERLVGGVDLTALESDFVGAAKSYSERKGISYAAWREAGVPPAVLKKAGIGRAAS